MKVKFWGTRGSIPSPGPDTVKYGGNTSCVSIIAKDELIILDGGSGLRELGNFIMKELQFAHGHSRNLEMWIFFSHVHWDHIQGIPFFKPMFIKGNKIHLYGEKKVKICLEDTLKGQQQYPNFPISIEEITINGAEMDFTDLYAGQSVIINGIGNVGIGKTGTVKNETRLEVNNTKLSHPDGVFCYKITEQYENEKPKILVYATDTEHRNVLDPRLIKIAKNADVLIYDAQYTPEEYAGKIGMPKFDWGHSTYEFAVDTAVEAEIKHLVLFHHEPEHTDKQIDEIEEKAKSYLSNSPFRNSSSDTLSISAAYEGMELEL